MAKDDYKMQRVPVVPPHMRMVSTVPEASIADPQKTLKETR